MNVLVVDDHPIMRFGVRQLIEREWPQARVDEAETLERACRLATEQQPDAVVLDLGLPDTAGTEGVARMLRVAKGVPVLVLSLNAESAYAARLLQMGAAGYLPKDKAAAELITALQRLREGRRYVTASMADHLVDLLGGGTSDLPPHQRLSVQEHRVMVLMAAGKTPADIAQLMHLSVKTVGTYRARILEKTGWKSNAELTRYCVLNNLADQP